MLFAYRPVMCSELTFKSSDGKLTVKNECKKGRKCPYAHTKEEQMYHPSLYKTQMCRQYPECDKTFCPFAHGVYELRFPSDAECPIMGPTLEIFPSLPAPHADWATSPSTTPQRISRRPSDEVRNHSSGVYSRSVPSTQDLALTPIGSVVIDDKGMVFLKLREHHEAHRPCGPFTSIDMSMPMNFNTFTDELKLEDPITEPSTQPTSTFSPDDKHVDVENEFTSSEGCLSLN